jgi:DNA-binding response OmpR family regulator
MDVLGMDNLNELKNLTILFADDDTVFREATTKTLEMLFKKVYVASNGHEALSLYSTLFPHIIMLDIRMGGMSGIEVAQAIRKINKYIPLFIVSSYTETHEMLEACKLNLVDYIIKPFSFQSLCVTLINCVKILKTDGHLLNQLNTHSFYSPHTKTLLKENISLPLTKKEITVLELLLKYRGQIVSYDTLIHTLGNDISNAALQTLMMRLRKKIGENAIHNLSKVGYFIK